MPQLVEPGQTAGSGTNPPKPAQTSPVTVHPPVNNPSTPGFGHNLGWDWPTNTTNTQGGWSFGQIEDKSGYTHKGVDIETKMGSPIYAVSDGIIKISDQQGDWNGGYGNMILMDTVSGGYKVIYAHLSEVTVSPGDHVTKGQLIGYTGGSPAIQGTGAGNSTGPHLHFEVRSPSNNVIDPAVFFPSPTPTITGEPNITVSPPGQSGEVGAPPGPGAGTTGEIHPPTSGAGNPDTTGIGHTGTVSPSTDETQDLAAAPSNPENYWKIITPLGPIYIPKPVIDTRDISLYAIGAALVLLGVLGFVLPAVGKGADVITAVVPPIANAKDALKRLKE